MGFMTTVWNDAQQEGKRMKQLGKIFIVGGACLVGGWLTTAQAPPGPLTPPPSQASTVDAPPPVPKKPEIKPRKSIMGAWQFNKDDSDDGRERLKQSREANTSNRTGNGGSGPHVGGGWPGGGMGGGPYGGHGGGYPRNDSSDESDRLGDLVNPPRQVKLSQKFDKDPEVYLVDDREHRRAFFTDGRKLEKPKDSSYEEIAAHWDGNNLVSDEKGAHGGKVSRTFELSSDGKQLWETIHLTDSKGNHPVTVRYVYDAIDESEMR